MFKYKICIIYNFYPFNWIYVTERFCVQVKTDQALLCFGKRETPYSNSIFQMIIYFLIEAWPPLELPFSFDKMSFDLKNIEHVVFPQIQEIREL